MSGIVWLASYPRSGNTWFRVFLTNLRRDGTSPADINSLDWALMASDRHLFDGIVGNESGDYPHDAVDRLRPRVYESLVEGAEEPIFFKIHDAYTCTDAGEPLVSTKATIAALYFIRNPLDLCVSLAHHAATEPEKALRVMCDETTALAGEMDRLPIQLRQRLMSWSQHVLSWVDGPPFRVHVVRYEDMHSQPLKTFREAATFVGMPDDPVRVGRALSHSTFANLQSQEAAHGFLGKLPRTATFFRQGSVGQWRQHLTQAQAEELVDAHRPVMRRFGYLTLDDQPVF